jgi:hypothetical protein
MAHRIVDATGSPPPILHPESFYYCLDVSSSFAGLGSVNEDVTIGTLGLCHHTGCSSRYFLRVITAKSYQHELSAVAIPFCVDRHDG